MENLTMNIIKIYKIINKSVPRSRQLIIIANLNFTISVGAITVPRDKYGIYCS